MYSKSHKDKEKIFVVGKIFEFNRPDKKKDVTELTIVLEIVITIIFTYFYLSVHMTLKRQTVISPLV